MIASYDKVLGIF